MAKAVLAGVLIACFVPWIDAEDDDTILIQKTNVALGEGPGKAAFVAGFVAGKTSLANSRRSNRDNNSGEQA